MIPGFDIPYEDLHMTKNIVRMELNVLASAIIEGQSITELHELLHDADKEIHKLENPEIEEHYQTIWSVIDHNYPISESTSWEVIESLGAAFRFIDAKTLY